MAEVEEMRLVIGGRSLRTSRGSSGVRMANFKDQLPPGMRQYENVPV
jgi:hypothetical protein